MSTPLMSGENGVTIIKVAGGERELTSSLVLDPTAVSAGGTYTCQADNGVIGRGDLTEANATLTIHGNQHIHSR